MNTWKRWAKAGLSLAFAIVGISVGLLGYCGDNTYTVTSDGHAVSVLDTWLGTVGRPEPSAYAARRAALISVLKSYGRVEVPIDEWPTEFCSLYQASPDETKAQLAEDIDAWLVWHELAGTAADAFLSGRNPYDDLKLTDEWREYDRVYSGSEEWRQHLSALKRFETSMDIMKQQHRDYMKTEDNRTMFEYNVKVAGVRTYQIEKCLGLLEE